MQNAELKPQILFVATREESYPRVQLTIEALRKNYIVTAIVSDHTKYWRRFLSVGFRYILLKKSNYELLYIGFFAQPLFPLFKFFWGRKIISDAFFSIYDTYILDKGLGSKKSLTSKLLKWLDRYMIQNSDLVFTDTIEHSKYLKLEFGNVESKIVRLWVSARENEFSPTPPYHYNNSSEETFRIFFCGNYIPLQGVDIIVRAASKLKNRNIYFYLYGTGQTFPECKRLKDELGLTNISFFETKKTEVRELSKSMHLLLGIFGKTDKAERVIPNKVFEALCLSKPLITGETPASLELLENKKDVIYCKMNDPEDLAEKICWCMDNYVTAIEIGNRGRKTFVEKCSMSSNSETLRSNITRTVRQ